MSSSKQAYKKTFKEQNMEFYSKLQALRKQKGITQEELAEKLFVSRTAVSKWESGRGYPNLDSLKAIASFFSVTIDELLSGDELLNIAEQDNQRKRNRFRAVLFSLLDIALVLLLFLPFFAQRGNAAVRGVSLLQLTSVSRLVKIVYLAVVGANILSGILPLVLQNCRWRSWERNQRRVSLSCNALGAMVFIVGLQPYASILLFTFLIIKVLMLINWQ